jgi:TorA maturation chaperone TorD
MYFLNSKSLEALQQRDFSAMFTAVQFQDRFLTEHVTQWVPAFCDDIAANTRHEFFRRLAEYIRGFIVEDCSVVQVLAPVLQNFLQA